jgi:hypothetical protein
MDAMVDHVAPLPEPLAEKNPYVAPATESDRPLRVHGLFLKWVQLSCIAAALAARFGLHDRSLGLLVAVGSLAVSGVVGVAWLAVAWTNFPPEDLHYTKFGRYTAFGATLRIFYYPLWTFRNLSLLCNAINDSLQRRSIPVRVPAAVGMAAPVVLLVGYVLTRDVDARLLLASASGAIWFLFMLQCDHARRFMILACNAGRERVAAARATMNAK